MRASDVFLSGGLIERLDLECHDGGMPVSAEVSPQKPDDMPVYAHMALNVPSALALRSSLASPRAFSGHSVRLFSQGRAAPMRQQFFDPLAELRGKPS